MIFKEKLKLKNTDILIRHISIFYLSKVNTNCSNILNYFRQIIRMVNTQIQSLIGCSETSKRSGFICSYNRRCATCLKKYSAKRKKNSNLQKQ